MRRAALVCLLTGSIATACGEGDDPASDSGVVPVIDGGVVEQPDGGSTRDAGGVSNGRVSLSTDTLDFGSVVVTSTASLALTITNPGNEAVQVTISELFGPDKDRFRRSLNTPDENGVFNIEPNGVVIMTVNAVPSELGPLLGVIALDSCSGMCPSAIVLQAIGVETGVVCPARFEFGTVNPGTCATFGVECENRGNATERITVVELEPTSSPDYTLEEPALPADLGPGDKLEVNVTYCPVAARASAGDIRVATFTPFPTERTIHLEGIGGGANVSCEPAELSFGTVGIGATIGQTITCHNTGVEPATVTAVLAAGTHFSVAMLPDAILPNGTGTILITASPSMVGTLMDTLQISTNDPDSPRIDVPLTMDAIMADPCDASITPATRDFGLVGVGETRSAVFTVSNTGSTVCLLRRVELATGSSANYTIGSAPAAGSVIAAGDSFDVEVRFTPTGNAITNGTLSVSFSNPGNSELTSMLTGTGGLTPVRVLPGIVDFGETPIGCDAPQSIRMSLVRLTAGAGQVTNAILSNESTPGVFSLIGNDVLPVLIDLGEEVSFRVGFQPPAPGPYSAELRIFAGGLPTPLVIDVVGVGVASNVRTESFSFEAPKVDVLFVIDNSDSMGTAQAALAESMNLFGQALLEREADFHFGVISTDFDDVAQQGRLIGGFVDQTSSMLIPDLVARVQIGIEGSNTVRPFDAVQAALTPPLVNGANAGFRRNDAALAIIFVGDEDDQSTSAPSVSQRVLELRTLAGGQRLYLASIAGPPNDPCAGGNGTADAGSRFAQLVLRAGGDIFSFCGDMNENIRRISGEVLGAPSFPITLEPRVASFDVSVNNMSVGTGWAYDYSQSELTFTDASLVPTGATVDIAYEPFCLSATCGNGTTEMGEECDDNNADDDDGCTSRCLAARCGDGLVQAGSEACDDANLQNSDACINGCLAASCGDGFLQTGVEECDDNNNTPGDGCPATCRFYQFTPPAFFAYTPLTGATPLVFTSGGDPNDDGSADLAAPFPIRFFDVESSTITVSINGFIGLRPFAEGDSYDNASFPDSVEPNGIIAVWWDDFFLDTAIAAGASIGYQVLGTAPNRELVIEWRNIRRQDHSTNNHRRFTFQVRIEETTNAIRMRYDQTATTGNPPTATSASAGIEDQAGVLGFEALGCSPNCSGQPRPQSATGFPEDQQVVFSP